MRTAVTRIGRAVGLGLAWAVVWVPIGAFAARSIVGELEPEHLAGPLYAALLCGALFSALGGVASGRTRLDLIAAPQALGSGALAGLLAGVLPFVLGDDGRYSAATAIPAVAISALAAALAARRLRVPHVSASVAAAWAAILSGWLFGALQYARGQGRTEVPQWSIVLLVIGGLTVLSAVSALASVFLAVSSRSRVGI